MSERLPIGVNSIATSGEQIGQLCYQPCTRSMEGRQISSERAARHVMVEPCGCVWMSRVVITTVNCVYCNPPITLAFGDGMGTRMHI